ncbi:MULTISPECIES: DNA-binding protein [Tepidanaerobacter]|uniref:DNA-binding protein n=1 Tax=Tepidanaerobacter TaxID=499228 RepID=UPI001BD2ED74|nr:MULTISPECIES: DNA-binding protein [Tepidanaerobacter]
MKPIYVAIVGLSNYFGAKIFKPGQFLRLVKDFENDYDGEAIMAILEPVGAVGYVANSAHTVPLGCYSAGRLYDTFDTFAYGIVRFVTKEVVIVEIIEQMQVEIYVDGEESLFNDNIDEDE